MKILTYFQEKQQQHSSTNFRIPKTFSSRTTGPILEDSEVGCIKRTDMIAERSMFINIFFILKLLSQMTVIHMFTRPCNISLQTVQAVPGCPDSLTSYQVAVKRKNCTAFLPIAAGCESLFYHCVLSDDNTHLVEVCAPTLNIIGRVCAKFDTKLKSIIRVDGLSCGNTTDGCPYSYESTKTYLYPECYSKQTNSTTDKPQSALSTAALVVLTIVSTTLVCAVAGGVVIFYVWKRQKGRGRTTEESEMERLTTQAEGNTDTPNEGSSLLVEQSESNAVHTSTNEIHTLPCGSIAQAQVWSHYTGFLRYVLPNIHLMIEGTQLYQSNKNRFPLLMYELVPENCELPPVIQDIPSDNNVKRITLMDETTCEHRYIHAGNTRKVTMPIYRITDRDGTEYFCVLEIPAVLSGIKKIITETPLAQRLQEKEIKMHVTEFYYALAGLLNHPKLNSTFNKARVISYNGDQDGFVLADEILKAIKQDLISGDMFFLPAGDVASVLAWTYSVNYLTNVMSGLTEVITETLEGLNQPNDSCPKKLFLIIPKSCDIRKSVADKDDKIKEVKTMHATHYGTSKRSYTFDMYKLRYEGKH
uniref:Uncharacterized protein LOC111101815 isoform X3 n=1 Tax=Crassostrea virginica TaxID=6565 RepID=A0A8B8AF68_CRAVI|nr:uncharacterized protein LOC111101815 isoform X3 [Crassostrea virginica]